MSRVSKTLKNLVELDELKSKLESFTRGEVYRKLKPTIDAANKRLKRQGVDLKLSTKGKSSIELIATTQDAIKVQPKRLTKINENVNKQNIKQKSVKQQSVKQQNVKQPKQPKQPKTVNKQPRFTKVIKQMPLNFSTMTREELVKVIQPTIDAANKRLKRLEGLDILSPALQHVQQRGGKFSLKGKNRNQVLKESFRAIEFINKKTSTVTGTRENERILTRKLGRSSQEITNEQRKLIFDAFRKLEEMDYVGSSYYGSDNMITMVANEVVGNKLSFDEMITKGIAKLDEEYKRWRRENGMPDPMDLVKP